METIIAVLFLCFVIFCIALIAIGINKVTAGSTDNDLRNTALNFLIISAVWITLLLLLAYTGFLTDFSSMPPRLMIVLSIPLITILYFTFSQRSNKILDLVPHHWMVNIQSFRIVVELFLWWMFLEEMVPVQMTFEGLNFDILAGLAAPVAAVLFFKKGNIKRIGGILWNIAGLLLLINIVTIAVLSIPSPFRYFSNEPSNTIVGVFPFVLLPGILVPIAYAMHFLSLKKLLNSKE